MSLKKSYVLFGETAPNAVHKIYQLTWQSSGVDVFVGIYQDLASSQDGSAFAAELVFHMDSYSKDKATNDAGASADNAHAQAYTYLKTLSEYTGAEDI